ncbi:hypothetical protein JCM11957_04130 [Caminibacter profundus]
MILIDANYIIRLFTKTPDKQYQEAKELFEKIAKREIKAYISEGIIMECFFVLHKFYDYSKEETANILIKIMSMKNIINDEKEIIITALELLKKYNIDFIDCLLCARANILTLEVKSFDKDIKKCLK